jgi:hypothetical protein
MAKFSEIVTFSDYFHIEHNEMLRVGAFDPALNIDSRLFLDPVTLRRSDVGSFAESAIVEYRNYYNSIIHLLRASRRERDIPWVEARRMLIGREFPYACLGFGQTGSGGRRVPSHVVDTVVSRAKEIVDVGIENPELFILLPLFVEQVGPDTIGDMTSWAVSNTLFEFTQYACSKLNVDMKEHFINNEIICLPTYITKSGNREPVVLCPKDSLRTIPVAKCWEDISQVSSFNSILRYQVSKLITAIFKEQVFEKREEARNKLMKPEFLAYLLNSIDNFGCESYDVKTDEDGLVAWRYIGNFIRNETRAEISVDIPDIKEKGNIELLKIVRFLCNKFKFLVEEKGYSKFFFSEIGKPRHEEFAQKLLFSSCYTICDILNIDVTPEAETGRGPVDFKFSRGSTAKILVEIKLSNNTSLKQSFEHQLKTYLKAERSDLGIYIIVDTGLGRNNLFDVKKIWEKMDSERRFPLLIIDATRKKSGSKVRQGDS